MGSEGSVCAAASTGHPAHGTRTHPPNAAGSGLLGTQQKHNGYSIFTFDNTVIPDLRCTSANRSVQLSCALFNVVQRCWQDHCISPHRIQTNNFWFRLATSYNRKGSKDTKVSKGTLLRLSQRSKAKNSDNHFTLCPFRVILDWHRAYTKTCTVCWHSLSLSLPTLSLAHKDVSVIKHQWFYLSTGVGH